MNDLKGTKAVTTHAQSESVGKAALKGAAAKPANHDVPSNGHAVKGGKSSSKSSLAKK